jgi:hypothetical protein
VKIGRYPVKIVAIDPAKRSIAVEDVTPDVLGRFCAAPSGVVAKLPNADVVLAGDNGQFEAGFSIGGSKAIRGPAIVLGKRAEFGERFPARSTVETLERLVRWLEPEPIPRALSGETITVILVDPQAGTIDHVQMDCSMAGIDALVGEGEVVPVFDAPGGDVVYGRSFAPGWRWRKDDCIFNGRCVIVGRDRTHLLRNPVASVDVLRSTVEFGPPGKTTWMAYGKFATGADAST